MKDFRIVANRPLTQRPPATPEEVDDNPHADVLVVFGRLCACLLIVLVVVAFVVAVLSLEPVEAAIKWVRS